MTDSGDRRPDRRSFLRISTAIGTVVGLSGCVIVLPNGDGDSTDGGTGNGTNEETDGEAGDGTDGDGDSTDGGTGDGTEGDNTTSGSTLLFEEWVPATSRLDSISELTILYRDVREISSNGTDELLREFNPGLFGVEQAAVTENMRVFGAPESGVPDDQGPLVILLVSGDFDTTAVKSTLEGKGGSQIGSHRGSTLYAGVDNPSGVVVAVSESEVMAGIHETESGLASRETIETFLDTQAGVGKRFAANSTEHQTIIKGFDTPHYLVTMTKVPSDSEFGNAAPGAIHLGFGWTFTGTQMELVIRWLFESEGDVDPSSVRSWARGMEGLDTYDYDVTTGGRIVELRGSTPTSQFDNLQPGTPGE